MKKGICGIDTWDMRTQRHLDPINIFCQELATETVYGLDGKPLRGKVCSFHKKDTELLMQATNGFVTAIQSKN